jgi:hypothetical protein
MERAKLDAIRTQFDSDPAFLKAAETDLAGTLRTAGLEDVQIGKFHYSDTDEHGNSGTTPMGLKQIWICEIDGDSRRCWCTNCQNY